MVSALGRPLTLRNAGVPTRGLVSVPCGIMESIREVTFLVEAGRNMPKMDTFGKVDPYVKLKFGEEVFQSNIVYKEYNPVWGFTGTLKDVNSGQLLVFEVFDKDKVGKDERIGEYSVNPLHLAEGATPPKWVNLRSSRAKAKDAAIQISFVVTEKTAEGAGGAAGGLGVTSGVATGGASVAAGGGAEDTKASDDADGVAHLPPNVLIVDVQRAEDVKGVDRGNVSDGPHHLPPALLLNNTKMPAKYRRIPRTPVAVSSPRHTHTPTTTDEQTRGARARRPASLSHLVVCMCVCSFYERERGRVALFFDKKTGSRLVF